MRLHTWPKTSMRDAAARLTDSLGIAPVFVSGWLEPPGADDADQREALTASLLLCFGFSSTEGFGFILS
jgi:hypothetical protein